MDSGVVLAFGAPEPLDYWPTFHQLPSFQYLTGFDESDAVLLMVVRDRAGTATLFVPARTPVTERWVGPRTRSPTCRSVRHGWADMAELRPRIDSLAQPGFPSTWCPTCRPAEYAERDTLTAGWRWLARLRTDRPYLVVHSLDERGDPAEGEEESGGVALLRQAAKISGLAHREAMEARPRAAARTRSRRCSKAPSAGWAETARATAASWARARTPPSCTTWKTAG